MSMKGYIQQHLKIRNKIISSQHSIIADSSTTMEFITQGLLLHPLYEGVHDHFLLQIYLNEISYLSDNLQKLEVSRKHKIENPIQPPQSTNQNMKHSSTNRGRGRYLTRNRWQGRQPYKPSNQEPAFTMNQGFFMPFQVEYI